LFFICIVEKVFIIGYWLVCAHLIISNFFFFTVGFVLLPILQSSLVTITQIFWNATGFVVPWTLSRQNWKEKGLLLHITAAFHCHIIVCSIIQLFAICLLPVSDWICCRCLFFIVLCDIDGSGWTRLQSCDRVA